MYLKEGVYFFRTPKHVYVRDTTTRMDYLFNDIVYSILSHLKSNDCSFEDLYKCLCTQYDIHNDVKAQSEISSFIDTLIKKGIVVERTNSSQYEYTQRIKDRIKQEYNDDHRIMFATFELTYRCNERCIHCYVDDNVDVKHELMFEDYKSIVDQLCKMGCMSILLTGGECTLRDDFLKIASYIVNKGMLLDVFTNGYNLSEEMIDRLIELKPNSVSFSFYAGNAHTHDAITGIAGSFEKSLKTLMICKCAGIDTYIKSVIMKQNVHEVESLAKLAKRLNVELLLGMQITDSHCGKDADQFRLLNEEEYLKVFEIEMMYYPHHLAHPSFCEKSDICATGKSQLSIDPYGNVYPCNAFPASLGNVKDTQLKVLWETSPILKEIRKYTYDDLSAKCKSCKYKSWCFVCLGAALRENQKISPCTDTCMLARASYRIFKMKGGYVNG